MQINKKRLLALFLAVVCVLPTVSCTVKEESNNNSAVSIQTVTETPALEYEGENPIMKEVQIEAVPVEATAAQLIEAKYPKMAQYPETNGISINKSSYEEWQTSLLAQRPENTLYQNGIREFYEATMQVFLKDTENKNKVYSPLNVYMALAMLAETTDGESRQQILNLLGSSSIEELRNNASILWNANYCDDGTVTSLLASSAWLSDSINYKMETLETLAEYYYGSAFSGTMGSATYNEMLQNWLNEQTGGLLEEQAGNVEMDPQTVLALATTVYFRAKWEKEFNQANNTEEIFHTASEDVKTEFMHQLGSNYYFWGENFGAVSRSLKHSGEMLLILPDEDVTVESLLADREVQEFIYEGNNWENKKFLIVNQSIPKFDVTSEYSLVEGLKKLGVTDVFDFSKADFTPLTSDTAVVVNNATHAARVMIDEEGCIAAAFTVMLAYGAARPPEEQMDFILDRPFLFVLKGQDMQPLFIGIVNQPN